MDFLELTKKRYSVRKFTDEIVSEEDLNYVLECMRMAPSATNAQPWKFLVARSAEARGRVCQCYARPWLATAPVIIVGFKQTQANWVRSYDQKPHGDVDMGIVMEHAALAAAERGLGSCWICAFDPAKLRTLFPQPEGWEAVVVMPVGHIAPDCPDNPKRRKSLDEIVTFC